jgi:hypothetical protein
MRDLFTGMRAGAWTEVVHGDLGDREVLDLHSQFAFSGLRSLRTSMERLPWDVARMTVGSTPISFPIL